MAKTFTKEDVATAKTEGQTAGEAKGAKAATKNAVEQLKAEIDRVKASDLSKPEQKAAIAALKNAQAAIKSPIG
ncbi:hypothetical protein AXL3_63 [Stenotrophomonas phage vB_SmaS-AXL_3]|uniref:Uncharacterized protein n=1 Tax=Stenotrophomonas phage vB_SmaS-AXL_3 TaxID=2740427 RepID=A0A7D4XPJ6_9CAUD|nr:hypothetical protein PQE62_gp63 [Stenotrophomonas phage vB_SmaS-AXL_3]QKW95616.1 hypothetical protein AXL3_63 [Stenotrophomonas phage vB_SmaS-AXL_3]